MPGPGGGWILATLGETVRHLRRTESAPDVHQSMPDLLTLFSVQIPVAQPHVFAGRQKWIMVPGMGPGTAVIA